MFELWRAALDPVGEFAVKPVDERGVGIVEASRFARRGAGGDLGEFAFPVQRRQGSAAVVDAARTAKVPRLVQESVVMIYRDKADRWIDEDWPTDQYPAADGNHAAEANARPFGGTDGSAVILRFGIFYGPGAAHSEQIMAMARRHMAFQAGRPQSYVSSIHLADAASAVVEALNCRAGTYNVVDDEPVTARDNALAMAEAVGAKPWLSGPGRLALLLGDRTTSMTRSLRVSNTRFRSNTAWKPRYPSVREGYRAMADATSSTDAVHARRR